MSVQFKMDWEKTLAAITYLAARNLPELSKGKLCKLLFLADKYHLVRFGRPITGDFYWAVDHGPIPSVVKDRLDRLEQNADEELATVLSVDRNSTYPHFYAKNAFGTENLSESDFMALDRAIAQFGNFTFTELRRLTHAMPAYERAWEQRPEDAKRAPMSFEDFFEEDKDAVTGAREEMLENHIIEKLIAAR
jgi:uncharacterized phage-associated protein